MSTREKIILAAVELFVHQGIARTTTKEIATAACVAEGSIYRYFPSKDELAWQVFEEYHKALAEQLQKSVTTQIDATRKIDAMVGCFFKMADEDWLMFRYYLTSQHAHMQKVTRNTLTPYKVILKVVKEITSNKNEKNINAVVVSTLVMGAMHQIAINKIYGRLKGDLSVYKIEVAEMVKKMLLTEA